MISIESKLTGDLAKMLDRFARHVQRDVTFSGAAAMAKVIYEEAKAKCPVSSQGHNFYGTHQVYYFPAGTLKNAIYRTHSPEKSSDTAITYRVSWNHQKAPYGFMVEFGTSHAPAHPFMRPAFDKVSEAIEAGKNRMAERLQGMSE